MRSRYSRRRSGLHEADAPSALLADQFTILGQGEPPLFSETLPGEPPPPVPVPPPTDVPPPSTMPAYQVYRPAPLWVNVDTPAAGAEWVYRHEYDWPAQIVHCYYRLVTSAVVGNRQPILTLRDQGGNRKAAHYPNLAQAAGITRDWQYSSNWYLSTGSHSYTGTLGLILCWLPKVTILPYEQFGSELALNVLDSGDQLSNIKLLLIRQPAV